ncbi:MAG: DUF4091 domain-containing protein [Lentisphaeria bacterium]|nr:DUF4091 domain-containing protein [Lentisphaeria bacterium]
MNTWGFWTILRRVGIFASLALHLCAARGGEAPAPWHHPLYLGNGGLWRRRIAVEIRNPAARDIAGEPVSVRVGTGVGELALAGVRAESLRVCDPGGTEFLYLLLGPDARPVAAGPIPEGATLALPAECGAGATATVYVYFDNPSAWAVPDYLPSAGGLLNPGVEDGVGNTASGWHHDPNDAQHRTYWVEEHPHAGRKCLKTVVDEGAEHTWIATRQRGIHLIGGASYVMTAWVKAENVKGNAGWYIHVGNEKNTMILSPMLYAGEGTYGWIQVRAEFTAPAEANLADLGTVLRGTGTAWFDDIELACGAESNLTVAAGAVERLEFREEGGEAPWLDPPAGGARFDYRVPLRIVNLTDRPTGNGLVSVDLSSALARLQNRIDEASMTLAYGGQSVPFFRMPDTLLFEGDAPPRTVRTYSLYFVARQGTATSTAAAAPTGGLAANPALPGASEAERRTHMSHRDYEALLRSARNLVVNGDFEAGDALPDGWPGGAEGEKPAGTEMGLADAGLFGRRCARIHIPDSATPAWTGWRQDVPVQPGRSYLFSAWLRTENIAPNAQLHAHFRNAAGELCATKKHTGAGPALNGTRDWTLLSGLFTMPEDIAFFQLHLTLLATGTLWHDGVVLAEVVAGEAGALESRTAPAAGPGVAVWPVPAVVKVFREDVPPPIVPAARISAARNEVEPLQLAVRGGRDLGRVRVAVDVPRGPNGTRLDEVETGIVGFVPVDCKTNYYSSSQPVWQRMIPRTAGACDGWPGRWPDPILPRAEFDLEADSTQPLWLTVSVPENAPAGDYAGTVRLVRGEETLAAVPFVVTVRDFALPAESHVKAIYDCRQNSAHWHREGVSREDRLVELWRFMAGRRLCPDTIPVAPKLSYADGKVAADFAEYDRLAGIYFDELRFPHAYTPWLFYCFGWGHLPGNKFGEKPYEGEYPYEGVDRAVLRPAFVQAYQACLKAFWDHLKAKGWDRRVVLYISDEPFDREPEIRAQMKALCAMIHGVDPGIRIYSSTWHQQPEWEDSLDVWGIGHYGIVPEAKIRDLQAKGATIWWTTDGQMCTDTPYCAIERLLPHYCFQYGAEAYEFWGVDWLTYDPFQYGWHRFLIHNFGPGSDPHYVRYPNGDGFLLYPGAPIGVPGPVTSVRFEQAREGVEDYEYLFLLRQRLEAARAAGRDVAAAEQALAQAGALVSMPCAIGRYSTRILPDPGALYAAREAVALAIEALGAR